MRTERVLSIDDLAEAARRRLPPSIHGYVSGGSEDHVSLEANRAAFRRWRFLTRPLVDVSKRSQAIDLFGAAYASPVGIAPMGVSGLCCFDGDVALARAAAKAGVPSVLSAASTVPLELVMREAPGTWYQAYLPAQHAVIDPLLERLKAAGVGVLVITVDVQIASVRENELRNGFSIPLRFTPRLMAGGLMRPRWMVETFARTLWKQGIPRFENFTATRGGRIITAAKGDHRAGRAAMTWDELARIRERWPGRLLVKGLLRPEDARAAQRIGADGIFVSNHGGRQLDGAVAPLDVLPAMVAAAPQLTVLLDGGVRRGTDVLKALALGARAVFVGRPAMYGLAAGGEAGATHALALLRREIDTDLALLGCADVRQLGPDWLVRDDRLPLQDGERTAFIHPAPSLKAS
ncbi:alpha-hydroxy acid oxidase [Variovorax paradoxus]|uniref:alpha-hydroxy acid oxidase n=1 Tax=Variovorax paradoxus TaxID=34073 RepID=UPI0009BDF69B|nr:alpha-hydroxy acid oxidase [Variovorax paradoxus]